MLVDERRERAEDGLVGAAAQAHSARGGLDEEVPHAARAARAHRQPERARERVRVANYERAFLELLHRGDRCNHKLILNQVQSIERQLSAVTSIIVNTSRLRLFRVRCCMKIGHVNVHRGNHICDNHIRNM